MFSYSEGELIDLYNSLVVRAARPLLVMRVFGIADGGPISDSAGVWRYLHRHDPMSIEYYTLESRVPVAVYVSRTSVSVLGGSHVSHTAEVSHAEIRWMMFECPFDQLPLHISRDFLNLIARWRLRLGR